MGYGIYVLYNLECNVSYVPFWEAGSGSYSSDDFSTKLYWINSRDDIKCDMLGNFVEPPAEDRCIEGVLREGKKAVRWTRSECCYPVTVTATNWSYYYPYQAQSSKSKRTESYQKGSIYTSFTVELGGHPENGIMYYNGKKYWTVLESVKQTNLIYLKANTGAWLTAELYVCTEAGWVPVERVEVMRGGGYNADGLCNFWMW